MDDLFESSKALLDQVSSVATMEQPLSRELTQILVESRKVGRVPPPFFFSLSHSCPPC